MDKECMANMVKGNMNGSQNKDGMMAHQGMSTWMKLHGKLSDMGMAPLHGSERILSAQGEHSKMREAGDFVPNNPMTRTGEKVMRNMMKEYGSKKGKQVFYASMSKGKPGSSKWHK